MIRLNLLQMQPLMLTLMFFGVNPRVCRLCSLLHIIYIITDKHVVVHKQPNQIKRKFYVHIYLISPSGH